MNNKKIKVLVIAGIACVALCGTALAAPKGGDVRRAPQKARTQQQVQRTARPAQGHGGSHAAKPAPAAHKARPAQPKPARHEVTRHQPARPARHVATHSRPRPHYTARHHWARPVSCPPPRRGALRAWTWIDAAWDMIVDGICYYGDGYYYDGCNYYYNGQYYTTPPVVTTIVTVPEVLCW